MVVLQERNKSTHLSVSRQKRNYSHCNFMKIVLLQHVESKLHAENGKDLFLTNVNPIVRYYFHVMLPYIMIVQETFARST